jgi:MinD superfamily P-loop ATPase
VIIAVASGKGGTGKTTVSVNLARVCSDPVQLLDCDVEEPNVHLFLEGASIRTESITVPIPQLNDPLCDDCGECSRFCQYHAIVPLGGKLLHFPELCHGCGGCVRVCPQQAIRETTRRIGVVEARRVDGITLIHGCLDVGVASGVPLIRAVKSRLRNQGVVILDAPPGTSCTVVTTVHGVDFVVLVAEPTPFGLHDLELAVEMVRQVGGAFGVVVNRVGVGDDRVHSYCREHDIPVLLEIPDDRRIAEAQMKGVPAVDVVPECRERFVRLLPEINSAWGAARARALSH